jgi:hypothetical protein
VTIWGWCIAKTSCCKSQFSYLIVDALEAVCVVLSWGYQLHGNLHGCAIMQHLRSSNSSAAAAGTAEVTALHAFYMQRYVQH